VALAGDEFAGRRCFPGMRAPVILTFRLLILNEPLWVVVTRDRDGVTLESRAFPDLLTEELRVTSRASAMPRRLAELVWSPTAPAHEGTFLQERPEVSPCDGQGSERQGLDAPLPGHRLRSVAMVRGRVRPGEGNEASR